MKFLILFLLPSFLWLVCVSKVQAQSLEGITNKPDTSFTTYSAFQKLKKDFPGISIVHEFDFPGVIKRKSIVYCKTSSHKFLIDAFYPKEKSDAKRVAIIIIHGGGWRSGNRSQHYPLAESLSRLG